MPHAPHRLALLMIAAAMSFGEAARGQAPPPRQVLVDTAEPFAPGAEEQRIDTPSVFVWGTYQAGIAAGWHYRFYPDASAAFSPSPRLLGDRVIVHCSPVLPGCDIAMPDGRKIRVPRPQGHVLPKPAGGRADGLAVAMAYADWVMTRPGYVAAIPPPAKPAITAPPQPGQAPPPPPAAPKPDEQVRRLQQALSAAGYAPGPADGLFGPRTATAIRRAETALGLPVTGRPSQLLLDRLLQPAPKAASTPPPSPPAVPAQPTAPVQAAAPPPAAQPSPFDCHIAAAVSPRYFDEKTNGDRSGKVSTQANCGYTPLPGLTLRFGVLFFPIPGQQQPWDPDFIYTVDYQVTDDISVGYANYTGNRWPWHKDTGTGAIGAGALHANYRLPLPKQWLGIADSSVGQSLECTGGGAFSPVYFDNESGGNRFGKTQIVVSCGVSPLPGLSVRLTAFFYPIASQQQPWDPDFVYAIDYQVIDGVTLEYANYTGNRWPWDHKEGTGSILGGAFRIDYRLPF